MTKAEKKLWYEFLRHFKYRVLRQRPIDNYIVDFYCPTLKLIIEIDGATHGEENEMLKDEKKENDLKKYGLNILRFNNTDIYNNFDAVCERISYEIEK